MALGDVGIDAQVNDRETRIGILGDSAMLFPPSCLLHSLRVARPRQDIAPEGRDPDSQYQYTFKYRSSSHSLTFPMNSCHSPRFASTNRS